MNTGRTDFLENARNLKFPHDLMFKLFMFFCQLKEIEGFGLSVVYFL